MEKEVEPKKPLGTNRSSLLLARSHDSGKGQNDCAYCKGKRNTYLGTVEENLSYHKLGFTSTKFKYDDYERLLNEGFTRCGSYFYMRNIQKSCCEAYQYRVDAEAFKPSRSQKKVIKRFHKYLNHGRPKGGDPLAPDEDVNMASPEEVKEAAPVSFEDNTQDEICSKLKQSIESIAKDLKLEVNTW